MSGHDAIYRGELDRGAFIRAAREGGRVILTRATDFLELADIPPFHLLKSEDIDDQLKEIYTTFPKLEPFCAFLSRCVECNVPLEDIDKSKFADSIPPKAMNLTGRFSRCPSCGKLLWPGSHVDRMKSRLSRLRK